MEAPRAKRRAATALGIGLAMALGLGGCADSFWTFDWLSESEEPPERIPPPTPIGAGTTTAGGHTVAPGETVYRIAHNAGISVEQLAAANKLAPPYTIAVGQVLTIPGRVASAGPTVTVDPLAPSMPAAPVSTGDRSHVVVAGDTVYSISRRYDVDRQEVARINGLDSRYTISVGQVLRLPGAGEQMVSAQPQGPVSRPEQSPMPEPVTQLPSLSPMPTQPIAPRPESPTPLMVEPLPAPDPAPTPTPTPEALSYQPSDVTTLEPTPSGPPATPTPTDQVRFQWPVEGDILSRFGDGDADRLNVGINIGAPLGTVIRAAEGGVVAYAGNELGGFGNMVVVQHSGAWNSAYGHADSILVKRGDRVTKGQPIARVGSTGTVVAPQLHFEIRRGSESVDPEPLLAADR